MPAVVDLFWSFRSPYSYLAMPGACKLEQDFDVEVRFRPVLPLAVRDPAFFSPDNLKRAKYIRIDWPRRAEMLGMPHAWPSPDPIVQDMQTYKIAAEQPYIHRLTRLGVEAERRGHGIEFAREVSALIFGGTRDWHLGEHLAQAARRAGPGPGGDGRGHRRRRPATTPRSRPTSRRWRRPATGACRPSSSRASPSSARTASTRCAGGWARAACSADEPHTR